METARADQHSLNKREFEDLCSMVYDYTGIVLVESKREMVYRRIMRRVRAIGIGSFSEYFRLISDPNSEELPNFLNAITTNLTSFFRENHHFDYLKTDFLPEHERDYGQNKRLRIWSTASSTGEEPYSLAITLREYFGSRINNWDCKILATDLDTTVLETAINGIYKFERVENIPEKIQKKWFLRGSGDNSEYVKVSQDLQDLITFKQLNLMHDWPMRGPFDVIMCRNVLIYFDKPTQAKLLGKFMGLLRVNGVLMLGHSESIAKGYDELECRGKTIYVRRR